MGGDVLYRWGNPQAYRAGDSTAQKLFGQHDAQWICPGLPGAGHVLVFNNGYGRPGMSYSTVDEFIPPSDGSGRYPRPARGTPYGPASACWRYGATPETTLFSVYVSGAQRLPNGNTMVCVGHGGRILEVTQDSQTVWTYVNTMNGENFRYQGSIEPGEQLFRAPRYAPDYPGLAGRDLRPGYPLEKYRTPFLMGLSGEPSLSGTATGGVRAVPNPFRRTTVLQLGPTPVSVDRLVIYDALGRTVRTLGSSGLGRSASGIIWDGTDDAGHAVSRGIYYFRPKPEAASGPEKLIKLE